MSIKIIIYITTFLILLLIIKSCISTQSVGIADEDKFCITDEDCTHISFDCGDCDCGEPVSKNSQMKYYEIKQKDCKWQIFGKGAICNINCPEWETLKCMNNICIFDQTNN